MQEVSTQTIPEIPTVHNIYGSPGKICLDHPYIKSTIEETIRNDVDQPYEEAYEEVVMTSEEEESIFADNTEKDPNWEPIRGETIGEESELEELDIDMDNIEPQQEIPCHEETNPVTDRKYIVFETSLMELLIFCPQCGAPVLEKKVTIKGSMVTAQITCSRSHSVKWRSQPVYNYYPMGNILLSAACLFSGSTYTRLHQISQFLGLQIPQPGTFFQHQRDILFPVIAGTWKKMKREIMQNLVDQRDEITLIGDGRCDSPGFSAKYGTYTVMDSTTSKIVEFQVIQVTEVSFCYFMYAHF